MEETIELEVLPSGEIRMMYSDEKVKKVADMIGAEITDVPRASNVEFEKTPHGDGWTVRSAHDPDLSIRVYGQTVGGHDLLVSNDKELPIAVFPSREDAIKCEIQNFWDLLPPGAACPIPKKES